MVELACPVDVAFLEPVDTHGVLDACLLSLTGAATTDPHELHRPFFLQTPQRMEDACHVPVVPRAEPRHEKPIRVAEELFPQATPVCPASHSQGNVTSDGDHVNAFANAHPFEAQLPLSGSHVEHVAPRGQKPYRSPLPESPGVPLEGMIERDVELMEVCDHAHPAADPDESGQ